MSHHSAICETLQPQKITYVYFCFQINFPKNYISVTRNIYQEFTYHVFVCDSENNNYMENCLGINFLENLISVT